MRINNNFKMNFTIIISLIFHNFYLHIRYVYIFKIFILSYTIIFGEKVIVLICNSHSQTHSL